MGIRVYIAEVREDGDVERIRSEPRALQEPERRGEAEQLVAELVAGDQ